MSARTTNPRQARRRVSSAVNYELFLSVLCEPGHAAAGGERGAGRRPSGPAIDLRLDMGLRRAGFCVRLANSMICRQAGTRCWRCGHVALYAPPATGGVPSLDAVTTGAGERSSRGRAGRAASCDSPARSRRGWPICRRICGAGSGLSAVSMPPLGIMLDHHDRLRSMYSRRS